ncbi:hypothetical protein DCC85_14225 [Paenibacillus sp. CAA11]|uniref:phage distal tail protein n=1 Tax=Paenibacillus sp. CAA11 TaxID=1532905 RepID=UPI000D39B601|nr:phage tail domain-containing protein [Paenibacillus sp. CAA11]AWB45266.1 hypothetical protein DCC85_14225 [Paenibacillus sp. CAA11]
MTTFGGPFNRLPFNRPYSLETLFSAVFESLTEANGRLSVDFPVTVVFESASDLSVSLTREYEIIAAIESASELFTQLIRERSFTAPIQSSTEFIAKAVSTHVDKIAFTGDFRPGDRLVIDTRTKTITLNGVNVLDKMDGDFFELIFGANAITYTDNESVRSVLTRVTHRDRYLY